MTWKFSRLFMTRLDLQLGDHISGLHISVPLSLYASMKPLRSALGDILFLLSVRKIGRFHMRNDFR
jgi:hypothetical protein